MPELTDSNDLRQRILEEAKSRIPRPPTEDEVTARMLMDTEGCTWQRARDTLADMEAEGIVTVRNNGVENGKSCKVYKYKETK